MNVLNVYDKERKYLNKKILYKDINKLSTEEFVLSSHVVIFNNNDEILIQKRSSNMEQFPNMWDILLGGDVVDDQIVFSTTDIIEFKVYDKLGIKYDFSALTPVFSFYNKNKIDDIYLFEDDKLELENLKLKYSEVQSIIWANKEEIFQLIHDNKLISYSNGFIELIFSNHKKRGIIDII